MNAASETTNRLTDAGNDYLDEVAGVLGDLPRGDREDLLSDAADAIAELEAQDVGAIGHIRRRLGDPAAFADELRRSSGMPERVVVDQPEGGLGMGRLVAMLSSVLRWVGVEFRSAWWLLRAGAVGVVLTWYLDPRMNETALLLLGLVVASVVAGVVLRSSERRDDTAALPRGIGVIVAAGVVAYGGLALLDQRDTLRDMMAPIGEPSAGPVAYDASQPAASEYAPSIVDPENPPVPAPAPSGVADVDGPGSAVDPASASELAGQPAPTDGTNVGRAARAARG